MENIPETNNAQPQSGIFGKITYFLFQKQFNFKKIIGIYGLLFLLISGSFVLCAYNYVENQQLKLEQIAPIELQSFIEDDRFIGSDGKLKAELTTYEFNQLLKAGIENAKISSFKGKKITELQYDFKSKEAYIQVRGKKGKLYTFTTKTNMDFKNKDFIINLSDYRLGKYKSRLLGIYYKLALRMPSNIKVPISNNQKLIYIEDLKTKSDDQVEMTFAYDYDKLVKRFDTYKNHVDKAKLRIYGHNEKVSTDILNLFSNEKTSKEDVATFVSILESNKGALEKSALLMDAEGIKELFGDFSKFYAKGLDMNKVIEKSASELDKNLKQYHYDFSKMLLKYLYRHKQYAVENDRIYVNGSPLNPNQVLSTFNYPKVYDISVSSNSETLKATYHVEDKTVTKTILRKE